MKYSQDFYEGKYTVNIYTNFNIITNIELMYNNNCSDEWIFDLGFGKERPVIHRSPQLSQYNVKQAYELVNVMQEVLSLANAENLTLDMLVSLGYNKAE